MATKQVRKPGRPAKKTRRTFAAGGVVRLAQGEKVPKPEWEMDPRTLADAAASVRRGMSLTSDGNPTGNPNAGAPVTGQGFDRAADYGYNAVEAAVRGGRAAGNMAADYGRRAADAAASARRGMSLTSDGRPTGNPDAGAPMTGQGFDRAADYGYNAVEAAVRGGRAAGNMAADYGRRVADAAASARRGMSLTSDGRPTGNPDAGAPMTGQGFDRAADYGYNAVEAAVRGGRAAGNMAADYGRRVADATASAAQGGRSAMNAAADYGRSIVDAAAPALNRAAEKAKGFAQEAWSVSPIRDAAAAADDWATQYNRNAFGPGAAPVARGAPAPAEARRPGGTIGRVGRGPAAAPTDADFFSPTTAPPAAAPTSPPAAGAVPPSAPNNAYGTQDEILGAAKRGLKEQRAAGAVSPDRVSAARQQAQFEERNIARDRGQGMVGGSLAGQRAMADNALLQKWYSMPENQRGRMPASVENAKYRGADDTETAFNVARARIMEARLHPAQQAQALANLDKTRADMLNQAQQTRQIGDYQQGQLGNERERTGVARQVADQTGQNQQAQMAHQQRMAQLALDQGVAEGALLPDEEYQKERALDDNYNVAYEQRRNIRERARRILMDRMMKGETLQDVLANPGTETDRAMLSFIINPSVAMRPQKYAGGGMVSPQAPVYGGAPDAQRVDPLINAYRIYTTQSKAMGAPTVPFAEFSSLYAGAAQGPMQPPVGMARGGAVPAAGKMVIDTDPDAEEDSIPAMIDDDQPAALNSGEFVFPTDVTSYYGTKMLTGMIEKARTGGKPSGSTAKAV